MLACLVHGKDTSEESLAKPAIRPYPSHYVTEWTLPGTGEELVFRPIRAEDEPIMVEFHRSLSEETVYMRFEQALDFDYRTAHERLVRICFIDYARQMALVAERTDPTTGAKSILGVARMRKVSGFKEAVFALLVSDEVQGTGLGTALLRQLMEYTRQEGVERVTATFLPDNAAMARVCSKLGFEIKKVPEHNTVHAVKIL